MENLIEIKTNKNMEVVISGRELHEKLGIETRYNDWIKRMIDYGFTENIDFVAITQKRATAQGNKTTYNDHIIKIDMAKEICMIQRNEKGKIFRQYFIQVEKDYNSPEKTMARAIIYSSEKIKELEIDNKKLLEDNQVLEFKVKELEPIKDYYDEILNSKGTMKSSQIAADYDISAVKLNRILNGQGFIRKIGDQWILYKKYMGKGYTKSETYEFSKENYKPLTVWTQKGRLKIHEILTKLGIKAHIDKENEKKKVINKG